MAKFTIDIPSVETTIMRYEVESSSVENAIKAALESTEGYTVEVQLELDEENIKVHATGAIDLSSYYWSILKRSRHLVV